MTAAIFGSVFVFGALVLKYCVMSLTILTQNSDIRLR
jgi:hypothetical protein